jgi:hypothetical protein
MVLLAKKPASAKSKSDTDPVEIVIASATQAPLFGSTQMEHLAVGARVKVTAATARMLVVVCERGYYVDPADDDFDDKRCTLTKERQEMITAQLRAIEDRKAEREEDEAFARASRRAFIEKYAGKAG